VHSHYTMPVKGELDPFSERPSDADFQQQNLKAWQPLLTPEWVIGTFLGSGVLFCILGVVLSNYSAEVVEVEKLYCGSAKGSCVSGPPACADPSSPVFVSRENCSIPVELKITEDMKPPIYMFYKLTNFYQNHRRYVKSRSDAQLWGEGAHVDTDKCDPLEKWDDGSGVKTLYPCGLIANSYFNDTFTNATILRNGAPFAAKGMSQFADDWDGTGIAWPTDIDEKFESVKYSKDKVTRVGPGGFVLPSVEDESFIVWMRTAGLPAFKKLRYRILKTALKKGDTVTVQVDNSFPVYDAGEKFIVLSTSSVMGGKNDFLATAYIAVGVVSLLCSCLFAVAHCLSPRPLGDMKYFSLKKEGN
jgi:hypothetical protein